MKRILLIIITVLATSTGARAMSYEEAREQAWFLTDKMAYELDLTPEQYDRAYQINLDYMMSIRTASDCYGSYWTYRNADLRHVLFDWQYSLYSTLDYFFRPIRWMRSAWYFPVFDRYRRGYFYFSRPTVYVSYHGRPWHKRRPTDRSPYYGMHFRPGGGMRDHYHGGHTRPPHRPEYGRPGRPHDNGRPGQRPGHNDGNRPGGGNTHRPGKPDNERPGNTGKPNRPGKPGDWGHNSHGGRTTRPSGGKNGSIGNGARPSTGRGTTTSTGRSRRDNAKAGTRGSNSNSRGGNRKFGRSI